MITDVIMPKAGMDMQEGQIIKWFINEGDYIKQGEPLLEIITDKVNMEVEAEVSGYLLKIIGKPNVKIPVITTIGYIGEKDDIIPELEDNTNQELEMGSKAALNIEKEASKKVRATPAARRIAREKEIEILNIVGSGPKGRVQKVDVEEYKESIIKATPLARRIAEGNGIDLYNISGSGLYGKIKKEDIVGVMDAEEYVDKLEPDAIKIIPMSNMRKIIAERMSDSYFTAPNFTLNLDVDISKVINLRSEIMELILKETHKRITITDIILLATTKALVKHPYVNAKLDGDNIILHNYVNLALAVGLEEGLLTPVIKNADKMTLKEIVVAAKDIQERTLKMRLSPDELQGSTFTVSNLGMFGITHFNPIINQPNSAILGVNTITDKVVPVNGEVVIRPIMTLSLTLDHRVIDGVIGAKFLQEMKNLLENPMTMLI